MGRDFLVPVEVVGALFTFLIATVMLWMVSSGDFPFEDIVDLVFGESLCPVDWTVHTFLFQVVHPTGLGGAHDCDCVYMLLFEVSLVQFYESSVLLFLVENLLQHQKGTGHKLIELEGLHSFFVEVLDFSFDFLLVLFLLFALSNVSYH